MSLETIETAVAADVEAVGKTIAKDAQVFVKFVKNDLDGILQKVEAEAPVIESITRVLSPQAAAIETAAFTALGEIGQALDGVTAAAAANGVNLKLDQAAFTAVTNAVALVKSNVVTAVNAAQAPSSTTAASAVAAIPTIVADIAAATGADAATTSTATAAGTVVEAVSAAVADPTAATVTDAVVDVASVITGTSAS